MIPVKTQATIFHNLNSFSLKTMCNAGLVEYLTVLDNYNSSCTVLAPSKVSVSCMLYIRDSRLKPSSAAAAAAYGF